MKKIVCYGDSNTFGYSPFDGSRFDENVRWTSLLQRILGNEYEVINEGICDRTGFVDNPKGDLFSAQKHFPKLCARLDNVDILVLALGANDLQFQYDINFEKVEKGLKSLIKLAKTKLKNIIIIPPVILNEKVLEGYFNFQFDETSIEKSKTFGQIYEKIAQEENCKLFDINEFAAPSDLDGLHYDEKSHKFIADNLADFIKK